MRKSFHSLRFLVLCILILSGTTPEIHAQNSQKILSVEFHGLRKTEPTLLLRYIQSQPGTLVDSALAEQDQQRLLNLGLFADLNYSLRDTAGGISLHFYCNEKFTLIPLVSFGGIRENFWLELGATDYHFLGRGHTIGGIYRYYERHSFSGFAQFRYLGNSNWGLNTYASWYGTREPTYFGNQVITYLTDRVNVGVFPRYELSYNHWLEGGAGYLWERYKKAPEDLQYTQFGPELFTVSKGQVRMGHVLDRISWSYHLQDGWRVASGVDAIKTFADNFPFFWKLDTDFRYFKKVKRHGNFAGRIYAGIADNSPSPFAPFVIDSYVNIRGSGNRVARGTAQLVLNLEYRQDIVSGNWGAVQAVGFTDLGTIRQPGGKISDFWEEGNQFPFAGAGLRVSLRKIYGFTVRGDVAGQLNDWRGVNFVLGAGQYF